MNFSRPKKVPEELKAKLEQTDKEELERIEKYKRGELEEEDENAGIVMMKWKESSRKKIEDISVRACFLPPFLMKNETEFTEKEKTRIFCSVEIV